MGGGKTASGRAESRMRPAHQRAEWNRARAFRVLESRAPVVLPQLDRPGGEGHFVVSTPAGQNIRTGYGLAPLDPARFPDPQPARPGRDAALREGGSCLAEKISDRLGPLAGQALEGFDVSRVEGCEGTLGGSRDVEGHVGVPRVGARPDQYGLATEQPEPPHE